jgi:hypothetical protein
MVGELFHFSGLRTLISLLPLVTSLLGLGQVAAVNLQRHGSACHQGSVLDLSGLRTSYARPLSRGCSTSPTESKVAKSQNVGSVAVIVGS